MGLADMWNQDKKDEIKHLKQQMAERDERHAEAVSKREAQIEEALRERKMKLSKIQSKEYEEQEKLNDRQMELEREQKERKQFFDERLSSTSETNSSNLIRTQELFIQLLQNEREREYDDKKRLSEQLDRKQLRMEDDQRHTEQVLNERRRMAESEKLQWNNERILESHRYAQEIDETNKKHFESMVAYKKQKNQEEIKDSVQGIVFELRNDALDAVYERGKTELMTAYGKDIDHNDKRRAISQIKTMSFELHTNVGKIVAKIEAASTVENPSRAILAIVMKMVQKCVTLVNTMKSELTSSEILQMDGRDQQRGDIAFEADDLLSKVGRILGEVREDFESGGLNIKRSIQNAKTRMTELDSAAENAYRKVRDLPLPAAEHDEFNDVVLRTMDAISGGGKVATEQLKKQLLDGNDFAQRGATGANV